jgi:hypothetical protein
MAAPATAAGPKVLAVPYVPALHEFLDFRELSLDGKLHSVKVRERPADQARPVPLCPRPLAVALSRCANPAFVWVRERGVSRAVLLLGGSFA